MKNQEIRNHLAERFNKYQEYRKGKKTADESCSERFSEKVEETKKQQAQHELGGEKNSQVHRQPKTPPQLARSQHITELQAKRLAKLAPHIQESAMRHNVPVELICGVILQESGGNPKAKSHAGAQGLMQLMPATAKRFGVTNSYDAAQNIEGGTKYLRFLLDKFNGDIRLALAGYNAGEGAVEKHGNKIPPFRETQAYVPKVLGYTQSMINILVAEKEKQDLPAHARRV